MILENVTLHWCKVIGEPVAGYDPGSLEWSFDASVDEATVGGKPAIAALKAEKAGNLIKNKQDSKGNFIHLKRNAVKADGERAKNIRVVDGKNQPWDDRFIGNGSKADIIIDLKEYGKGKVSVRPIAIQVHGLVPHEAKSSFSDKGETKTVAPVKEEVTKEW
jgi:hypothetical protein